MIARWKACASTLAALVIGHGAGRYGLGPTIGLASLATFGGVLAYGLVLELRSQIRGHRRDDDIDPTHQQMVRALQEGDR